MKAAPFDYLRPHSVDEVCALLAQSDQDARIIAGGQTLVPMMAMRILTPDVVIDINAITELSRIEQSSTHLKCGALVRQAEALDKLATAVPLLSAALAHVGHPATRARGTLVGSICAADPSAETALVACVLDADIEIASATGKRVVGAREFVLGPLETCLEDHEFATAVRFPHWQRAAGGIGVGFEEMAVRHGDFALVACAAQVQFDRAGKCARASLGIANVTTTPLLPDTTRLLGSTLTDVMIDEFCAELAPLMSPPSDHVADADYRRRIALGLSARALTNARDKALAQP